MENPEQEISEVIHLLTQSPPSTQRETIEAYFTHDASFTHPFCRTGSFENSRFLIRAIYGWYKIMSPTISLKVNSVAFDAEHNLLYVNISQIFSIWIIPFHSSHVNLTTVLGLRKDSSTGKYHISSQNDLYQTDEFVKFFWFGGSIFVWIWQFLATLMCFLGALVFAPVSWLEEYSQGGGKRALKAKADRATRSVKTTVETPKGSGNFVTAPAIQQR